MKSAILSVALIALPVAASAAEYVCETTNFGSGGWVPEKIYLAYDKAQGQGWAYDGAIATEHDGPIPVDWKVRSATSYQFNWAINLKARNGGKGKSSYKVILFTDRNAFVLSGRRHGYDNPISGEGTCEKVS